MIEGNILIAQTSMGETSPRSSLRNCGLRKHLSTFFQPVAAESLSEIILFMIRFPSAEPNSLTQARYTSAMASLLKKKSY